TAMRVGGRIRVPELSVGGVTVRDVGIDGRWADQKIRLDAIEAHVGAGRVNGSLETGPIAADSMSVALELRELVLPGGSSKPVAGRGLAEGRVRDGGLDLPRAEASWRGVAASLRGRVAGGPPLALHASLSADLQEIARAMGWGAMAGHATVAADL